MNTIFNTFKNLVKINNNNNKIYSGIEFNILYPNTTFYKILNKNDNIYKNEINITTNIYKYNPKGYYFTELKYISTVLCNNSYICKIEIPNNAIIKIENNKFKTDKLILRLNTK